MTDSEAGLTAGSMDVSIERVRSANVSNGSISLSGNLFGHFGFLRPSHGTIGVLDSSASSATGANASITSHSSSDSMCTACNSRVASPTPSSTLGRKTRKGSYSWVIGPSNSACVFDAAAVGKEETGEAGQPNSSSSAAGSAGQPVNWIATVQHKCRVLLQLCHESPSVYLMPLLMCCMLVALGVWATLDLTIDAVHQHQDEVWRLLYDTASAIQVRNSAGLYPSAAVAAAVRADPQYPHVHAMFPLMANALLAEATGSFVSALMLAPSNIISDVLLVPHNTTTAAQLLGRSQIDASTLAGHYRRFAVLQAMESKDAQSYAYPGPHGSFAVGVVTPIFIKDVAANETFGLPQNLQAPCDYSPHCYDNATGTKFWGTLQSIFNAELNCPNDKACLGRLADRGLNYMLVANYSHLPGYGLTVLQGSADHPKITTSVHVSVPIFTLSNQIISLYAEPASGWEPHWKRPVLAGVVVSSVLMSAMLMYVLLSRTRHRRLLHAMLPPKVIDCLEQGKHFAESFDNVTILFSDVVQYTDMAAELSALQVAAILNEVYSLFDGLVKKHGVYKVETIGDAFMCVGGCPDPEAADVAAVRVANMALDMVASISSLTSRLGHNIRIRVGIHSGPAVAAVIGLRMPRYCLFGDTVNTASRMESNSAAMSIHMSHAAAALVLQAQVKGLEGAQGMRLQERGEIMVKGKGMMKTFWLCKSELMAQPVASFTVAVDSAV